MPRAKRPPVEFDVDLLVAGEATASGNVYPPEIIMSADQGVFGISASGRIVSVGL